MRRIACATLACLISGATPALASPAGEFKHFGDFLLTSYFKITGDKITPIPMKPIALRVFTDGVHVRISAEGDDEAQTTYEIYRSDGIGRQRPGRGALEVIPGLQATTTTGGVLRHLRLSREALTLTTFPGVSDQTIVSHAVAAEPRTKTTKKPKQPDPAAVAAPQKP
jgi:hypothetical protein